MNVTSDLPLDNTTHLTLEKTLNTIDITNKNDEKITQDDNHANIWDSQAHQELILISRSPNGSSTRN